MKKKRLLTKKDFEKGSLKPGEESTADTWKRWERREFTDEDDRQRGEHFLAQLPSPSKKRDRRKHRRRRQAGR